MNRAKPFLLLLTLLFTATSFTIAQGNPADIKEGFFINPKISSHGVIVTDDFESSLYIIKDGTHKRLFSAPGCGRFFTLSPDKNIIGFKFIDSETGLQAPAIFDLEKNKLVKLHKPVQNAGQVTFTNNGSISYTIENTLYVKGNKTVSYNLEKYSNWTPISPDGKFVIYKNDDDQLCKYELATGKSFEFTDSKNGYCNVQISPDSKRLVFNSIDAKVFTYNFESSEIKYIDEGEEPKWSPDGKKFSYYKRTIDFNEFKTTNSDIFEYDYENQILTNITNTPNIIEVNSSYIDQDQILYCNFSDDEITSKRINSLQKGTSNILYKLGSAIKPVIFYKNDEKKLAKNTTSDLDRWVHVHQVFDTRQYGTWTNFPGGKHQGYRCCGATSAMEVLASYKILPSWPMTTYSHTSNYGQYISDEFTFENYTFKNFSYRKEIGFKTGMHGYMWSNGSPSSRTVSFMQKFGVSASHSDYPSWSKITKEFENGYPYILCTTALTDAHIVMGIAQYGSGHTLYCNDPYGDKNAGSYGGIRNGKNAVYDWSDANTGHQKISPVVWGVTARFSPNLNLVESAPANSSTDLGCNANIVLFFDSPINPSSIFGNIKLVDAFENEIETEIDFTAFQYKKIILNPVNDLDYNTNYKVIVKKGITDVYSGTMLADTIITFKTADKISVFGVDVDNFEIPERYQLALSGAENNDSVFIYTDEEKVVGDYSGKLSYNFTSTSNGYYRLMDKEEFSLGANADSSFGIWISGDANKHTLELWFTYENGQLVNGFSSVIDWSGWKFLEVKLSDIADGDTLTFNSIAIRQNSSARKDGSIYFDGAVRFKTGEIVTDIHNGLNNLPNRFSLEQNYPNPFNPSTVISYQLPESGNVTLKIYNMLGEEIKTLAAGNKTVGKHHINFDASNLPSGVYIYRLRVHSQNGFYSESKKMMLVK
ncbi:MAG: Ig-like domain-containing protein [Melioribacteraceae bacterium]|nr:Ig-like domain-containing protein [Melioribacteraceae bacterium]